jgi:hypothetical protein
MEGFAGLFWDLREGALKILYCFSYCFIFEVGLDGNTKMP